MALPSAIMSLASSESLNENDSPGTPSAAMGSTPAFGFAACSACPAGVQACVIVSGLYWKTITLGKDPMNVGMNEIKAPLIKVSTSG